MMKKSLAMKCTLCVAGVFCMLLLLMTGCSQPDNSRNLVKNVTVLIGNNNVTSRTIMPQDYPDALAYDITLTSQDDASKTYTAEVSVEERKGTFTNIPIGSYTLNVVAYTAVEKLKPVYVGTDTINVSVNDDNQFTILLKVISSSDSSSETGTVSVHFDWTATDRTVTDIELLISSGPDESGVLQFVSEGKIAVPDSVTAFDYSKDVPVGKNRYAMFKLWNGPELIGETGVEILHVYLNMTSSPTNVKNYKFTEADFQPAEGVKQVSADSVVAADGSVGLKLDWTNPVGCDHQVITWKESSSQTAADSYTTQSSEEHSYTISGLRVKTEYYIEITTYYQSGLVSPAVVLVQTTAVPVKNVTLKGIPEALQTTFAPGSNYRLEPVVESAVVGEDATDLGYIWESSNESVAKVLSDGSVVAQKAGVATIKVTTVNSGKSASADVTVHLAVPVVTAVAEADGINISWNAVDDASSYEVKLVDGTPLTTIDAKSSVDSSVISYKDTALLSGNTYSYVVQAKATTPESIVLDSAVSSATTPITPATPTISIELPTQAKDLTDGVFENQVFNLISGAPALTISVTPIADAVAYQWMLNQTLVASAAEPYILAIDERTPGLNKDRQDNTITLIVQDAESVKYSAQTKLYYLAVPDTGVEYAGPATIKTTDGEVALTAKILPADASIQAVTWSLVNPDSASGICTLTADGKFTALDTGSVEVQMTTHLGKTSTTTINCVVPVKGISLKPTAAQGQHFVNGMNGYGEVSLVPVVESATEGKSATNQTVVWSTSNQSIATVDANGKVVPVGAGSVTITARTVDGNYSATYEMNVTKVDLYYNKGETLSDTPSLISSTVTEKAFSGVNYYSFVVKASPTLGASDVVTWTASYQVKNNCLCDMNNKNKEISLWTGSTARYYRGFDASKNTLTVTLTRNGNAVWSQSIVSKS